MWYNNILPTQAGDELISFEALSALCYYMLFLIGFARASPELERNFAIIGACFLVSALWPYPLIRDCPASISVK
jgi:hypothetical protein